MRPVSKQSVAAAAALRLVAPLAQQMILVGRLAKHPEDAQARGWSLRVDPSGQ
jgi:hypothetical protein